MKTSESLRNGGRCPNCGGEMTDDPCGRGFVRHKYPVYINDEYGRRVQCIYGRGERDTEPPRARVTTHRTQAVDPAAAAVGMPVAGQVVDLRSSGGEAITSVEEWLRLAPPERGEAHWKDWRSAKELARAWFRSGEARVPRELSALLESNSSTKGMVVERAIAEMPLRFDNFFGNPRKSDLVLFGHAGEGEGVLVAVEAKADEEFGPLIGHYRATNLGTASRVPDRIDQLVGSILGRIEMGGEEAGLRYQLLHGVAGALAEAGRRGLKRAIFVVHEFRSSRLDIAKVHRNAADLDRFVQVLGRDDMQTVSAGKLVGPFGVAGGGLVPTGIPVLIGKVVTHLVAPDIVDEDSDGLACQ